MEASCRLNRNEILMSVEIEIQGDIHKFDNLKEELENATESGIEEAAKILQAEIVASIRSVNAVASGELLRSVTISSLVKTSDLLLVKVGSSKEYAANVEYGRRAGTFPNVEEIYKWMITKGMNATMSGAYAIARKISEQGYEGKEPFAKALDNAVAKAIED
jgi:hypothetical protein